ncbi:PGPGW domain-containing protein [Asticcacaulis sp. YBE204]|uniref:PGPGW domain-containing protein n=1 Tax=Asticcacaulis sp. YBE204 TaxID=1282363 RepID=UPI0003C40AC6|nr:PGPGW domain-containing protein [Asticcacaulis sp. YBE204]ESQ77522.1 hypothetical protein AEYBE204_17430 [Asticcacaulis sp. YBE204]
MSRLSGFFAGILKPSEKKVSVSRALKVVKVRKKKNPVHRGVSRIWRAGLIVLGSLLVLLGILIAPLPGPMGMPVSIAGLIIVLKNSYWAKRQFIKVQRKHPKWLGPLRRLLRPRAKVVSIVWQQMLKTEKMVLKAPGRMLGGFRRRFLRKSKKNIFHTQSAK